MDKLICWRVGRKINFRPVFSLVNFVCFLFIATVARLVKEMHLGDLDYRSFETGFNEPHESLYKYELNSNSRLSIPLVRNNMT